MSLKNFSPMIVLIFKLEGGLNLMTFPFRFRLVFCDDLLTLALLNSVSSQDNFKMGLLVIDDNCLISDGGWLDVECMYRVVLFDFLKGKYDRGWNKQGVGMKILISWGGR